MKKQTKWISGLLCSVLAISAWGYTSIQAQDEKSNEDSASEDEQAITSAVASENIDLNEQSTVYVMTENNGSIKKVMASEDVLKNLSTNQTGSSQVAVTNIDGQSVSYKGNVEKDLPVDMKVTYKLNGKTVSAADLAGKSGKVKITYTFESKHAYDDTQVPFLTMTGMILDEDVFDNVSISNGKVITQNGKDIVIGLAFPGLNTILDSDNLPDEFSIEADVSNFELGNTLTYVSDSLLDSDNLDSKDAQDLVSELTDGINSLIDGSSQLYEGMNTLMESTSTFSDGVDQLVSGAGSLSEGAGELQSGAASLQSGAATLSSGLNELSGNNSALVAAAGQIFQALIDQSNSTLASKLEDSDVTIDNLDSSNYNEVLDGLLEQMDADAVHEKATQTALTQIEAAVESNSETIETQVSDAVEQQVSAQVSAAVQEQVAAQVKEQVLASQGITEEIYEALPEENKTAIDEAISANTAAQMSSDTIQATIAAKTKEQMSTSAILATIAQNVEATKQQLIQTNLYSDEVQSQISSAVSQVSASAAQVSSLKGSLNSYQTFYNALVSYTNGVASAAAGASALSTGMDSLYNGTISLSSGAVQLESGLVTLQSGTAALTSGISQLEEGSMQLSEGILDGFGEIPNLEEKLETAKSAIQKYNKDYTSYKFIYKSDAVK